MIRFWEIERREEINITHKSLLRWNAVTNFYCIPLLFIHWQTRKNRDIQKYQYLDYHTINPLDVVKHNVKLLCDFYRLSSITKFAETGIHKHQYFDYQMTTHMSWNTTHGYLKHLLLSFHKFAPSRPERLISCQSASRATRTLPCHRWHYSWFWRDNYR